MRDTTAPACGDSGLLARATQSQELLPGTEENRRLHFESLMLNPPSAREYAAPGDPPPVLGVHREKNMGSCLWGSQLTSMLKIFGRYFKCLSEPEL